MLLRVECPIRLQSRWCCCALSLPHGDISSVLIALDMQAEEDQQLGTVQLTPKIPRQVVLLVLPSQSRRQTVQRRLRETGEEASPTHEQDALDHEAQHPQRLSQALALLRSCSAAVHSLLASCR